MAPGQGPESGKEKGCLGEALGHLRLPGPGARALMETAVYDALGWVCFSCCQGGVDSCRKGTHGLASAHFPHRACWPLKSWCHVPSYSPSCQSQRSPGRTHSCLWGWGKRSGLGAAGDWRACMMAHSFVGTCAEGTEHPAFCLIRTPSLPALNFTCPVKAT